MNPEALQIIKDEHQAIGAVMYCLRYHVNQVRYEGAPLEFRLLSAIFDYIVDFPDRCHHPKEDEYLFAAIRRRTGEADTLIGQFEAEHRHAYPMIERLGEELLGCRGGDRTAIGHFFDAVEDYAAFQWAHMRAEEDHLLPIAERVLTAEDWAGIGAAFRENDNPLFGLRPRQDLDRLYRRILELAPAPLGFSRRSA